MKHSASLHPVFAIATLTLLLGACSGNSNTTAELPVVPVQQESAPSSTTDVATLPVAKKYADGTFAATGNYRSPAGAETVEVSLTLKDGLITDAVFKGDATAPRSMMMQGQFAAGFREQVVGQSIDSLSLGVVNGSSLTPKGFMDAVAQIKTQATAS